MAPVMVLNIVRDWWVKSVIKATVNLSQNRLFV